MRNSIEYRNEKLHHKIQRHAKQHVHRLREKPESHRKAIAFGVAFTVTFIVFVLWYFLSLPKIMQTYETTKAQNARLNDSPLDDLKDAFSGQNPYDYATATDNIEITQ